jgi:hypothetical protein
MNKEPEDHHTHFTICQLKELYHCLDLPVSLTISTRDHKAASEKAFIITLTKLATGSTSTSLVRCLVPLQTPLSPGPTKRLLSYSTIRQMGCYIAIGSFVSSVCKGN